MTGKQSNDPAYIDKKSGRVRFKTNNAGGILGGISNGEEIRIRIAIKPTPTIALPQETVNMKTEENVTLEPITRRDPSICPRIYPVCEAMVRCSILDALYKGTDNAVSNGINNTKEKRLTGFLYMVPLESK